jgi:hypothetical protein
MERLIRWSWAADNGGRLAPCCARCGYGLPRGAVIGKRQRRSHDRKQGQAAIGWDSAWASTQRLALGHVKVAAGSNEITAQQD